MNYPPPVLIGEEVTEGRHVSETVCDNPESQTIGTAIERYGTGLCEVGGRLDAMEVKVTDMKLSLAPVTPWHMEQLRVNTCWPRTKLSADASIGFGITRASTWDAGSAGRRAIDSSVKGTAPSAVKSRGGSWER